MSDLNIRLNLDSTAAAAAAAGVQGDLNKLKTDAEKPIKIKVDIDGLQESEQKSKDLKKNLEDLKSQALAELSQHAAQFAEHLGGVEGKVASIAIKSLSAFGPMGQQIGAVMGVVALAVTAFDDYIKEQDLIAAKTNEITNANNNQAGAYPSLITAINSARTAEELHNNVLKEKLSINSQIAVLLQGGTGLEAAQAEITVLQQANRAHQDVSVAMMETALHTGNAAVQQQALGFSFTHSTNAVREHIQIQDAVSVIQARNAAEAAAAARAANQRAVDNRRAAREALQDAAAEQDNAVGVNQATNQLRVAENEANAAFIQMNRTEAESNRLHDLGVAATGRLAGSTNTLTESAAALNAQFSRDQINKNNARASAAGAASETALQRRAGEEALRLAEQTYAQGNNSLTLFQRQEHATQALSFAEQELTRARTASESHGQTAGERTQLLTALNNEATARHAVAEAIQAQTDAATQHRANLAGDARINRDADDLGERLRREDHQREASRRKAMEGEVEEASQRSRLLSERGGYTGKLTALMGKERTVTGELAASTKNAISSVGTAMASHAQAMIQGKEDIGDALQGMLKDVLSSIGSEAMIKGAMMMAEGAAALAGIYTAPLAAGNFAAGAAFFGVGALASAAGAAIPASASAGGGGGGASAGAASSASTSHSETPMRSGGSSAAEAPSNITINMNAFQSNDQAQALIVRSLREAGYRNIR